MRPFSAEYTRRLEGAWTDIRDQLHLLHERACRYDRVQVAEFGVRTGESTSAFLAAAEHAGGRVFSYDTKWPQVPAWWHDSPLWAFTMVSSLEAVTPAADVLFIDTSHKFEDTLAELRRHVPAVRPGGVVLCHDTRLADPPFEPYAVARALDRYCAETGREWAELGGRYGLGQITIPGQGEAARASSDHSLAGPG